ncbi:MAG: hypothetical protein V3V05_10800 [Pontiella sp.]
MKFLKNILVVMALLIVAFPCCHAVGHDEHAHEAGRQAEICATHACACHTCGDVQCDDEREIPQELTVSSTPVAIPAFSVALFIFNETKPRLRQHPISVYGTLASLQTIQLLI